jgi:hypothetical protein
MEMKKVILFILVFLLLLPSHILADWFSDYSGSIVSNGPAFFENQKRGYATGGSVSYRSGAGGSETFLKFSAPRIDAGCGGIDMTFGGLSYLNPEYLVQAFQNIMQAAPAFAFKLALTNLCSQCDGVMTSLEGLANAINNFAMDECGAAKAAVNAGGDLIAGITGFDSKTGAGEPNWSKRLGEFSKDVNGLSKKIKNLLDWEYCGGFTNHSNQGETVFGMNPTQCKSVLQPSGSLWMKVLQKIGKEDDTTYKNLIGVASALFGDVYFTPPGKTTGTGDDEPAPTGIVEYVPPCATDVLPEDMVNVFMGETSTDGSPEEKDIYIRSYVQALNDDNGLYFRVGDCSVVNSIDTLPKDWQIGVKVENALNDIIVTMIANNGVGSLKDETIEIINQTSTPVYQELNVLAYRYADSGTTISGAEKESLKKMISISHIDYILNHFVSQLETMLGEAEGALYVTAKLSGSEANGKAQIASLRNVLAQFKKGIHVQTSKMLKERVEQMKNLESYYVMKRQYIDSIKKKNLLSAYNGI